MYWDDAYDVLYFPIRERRPTAKKEHTCCEHKDRKIAVGEKYVYIAGMWCGQGRCEGHYFKDFKICLGCDEDWDTVLKIFHENGEDDACIVYGRLGDAVWDALENGYIDSSHPLLVKKWYPDEYRVSLRKAGESDEEIAWKDIEEVAVKSGLQLTLPGL